MNVFSEVYEKSVEMLKTPQLHADWAAIESGLKALLLQDGPSPSKGDVLEDLRKRLVAAGKKAKGAAATALINAASWAYFCGDVLGAVPRSAVKEALS